MDIWDFNDEESVNDKFGKINQVGHGTLNNNKHDNIQKYPVSFAYCQSYSHIQLLHKIKFSAFRQL